MRSSQLPFLRNTAAPTFDDLRSFRDSRREWRGLNLAATQPANAPHAPPIKFIPLAPFLTEGGKPKPGAPSSGPSTGAIVAVAGAGVAVLGIGAWLLLRKKRSNPRGASGSDLDR